MKRILVVEPYYGGSHKHFLLGLKKNVNAEFIFLTLPARKWKLRMQLSAPWFVRKIEALDDRSFATLLCSTFVDVAVLRSLLSMKSWWNKNCTVCTYYHENQFIYPEQVSDKSRNQFMAINFTTALASDKIAFNSNFNLQSFMENAGRVASKASDMKMPDIMDDILLKATVIYPGIDFEGFADVTSNRLYQSNAPVICWNHRWEHDKNPKEFFETLFQLHEEGYDYRLIILGQSFREEQELFLEAKERLDSKIIHFGYVRSKKRYIELLHQADIVVSTSYHEFYGISVLEAVRAGCLPLVPNRLSYKEIYPEEYRYEKGELKSRLIDTMTKHACKKSAGKKIDTDRFSWSALQPKYNDWLLNT